MAQSNIETFLNKFNSFTEKPVKFLSVQNDVKDDIKNLVKSIYDYTKEQEDDKNKKNGEALPKLIVEDLDEEQIWQEIELQNNECWDHLVWEVANCMSLKNNLVFPVMTENELAKEKRVLKLQKTVKQTNNKIINDVESQDLEDQDMDQELEDFEEEKRQKSKIKVKPSIVDDKFFKLQEMEEFLLHEERKEGKSSAKDSDEESIDYFDANDDESEDDDEETNLMYRDFFDENDCETGEMEFCEQNEEELDNDEIDHIIDDFQEDKPSKKDKRVRFAQPLSFVNNDSDQDTSAPVHISNEKSEFNQLKKKDKRVRFAQPSSSKDNDSSDDNSPSEDDCSDQETSIPVHRSNEKKSEFEQRQERLKQTIERLEQKTLKEAPWQLKGEVDASKRPQNSLLQEVVDFDLTTRPAPIITEQTTITLEDIIKQRIKDKAWDDVVKKEKPVDDQLSFRKTEVLDHAKSKLSLAQVYEAEYLKQKQSQSGDNTEEKEPEAHTEIKNTMSHLFAKLDALCHYHYTPKAVQPEVKIVTNTPAISMEEVAPIATSDATLLAPEEVKKKQRGDLMSKEERTETDKKRERRKKKKMQKAKGHVPKVTDNRNTKQGMEANDKSFKTSKAFFQQLNDDTTSLIKANKNKVNGKNIKNKGN